LSEFVEKEDVEEAIRLIDEAMKMSAMDPTTGLLDMDLLTSGHSAQERKEVQQLKTALSQLLNKMLRDSSASRVTALPKTELYKLLTSQSSVRIPEADFEATLEEVVEDEPQILLRDNYIQFERAQ
jgi:DNA replication licensing factor MCM4